MHDIYSELPLQMHHRKAFIIYVANVQTHFDVFSSELSASRKYETKVLKHPVSTD